MDKTPNRYENKAIRFYDKGDHYELWFMDEFNNPGSGKMWEGGSEYTLICDIAEDLHNGDSNKELHILIWSMGGCCSVLSTLLECISRYRHKVGVNLGVAASAGWLLFFACDERYTATHSEFLYHEPSFIGWGKTEEQANTIEFNRKRLAEILKQENMTKYLTKEERKLGQTSEVWLTGAELIKRGGCRDYALYHRRIAPKPIKNEFFTFNNRIYRVIDGKFWEYIPDYNTYSSDQLLTFAETNLTDKADLKVCLEKLEDLCQQVGIAYRTKNVAFTEEVKTTLLKLIGKYKE